MTLFYPYEALAQMDAEAALALFEQHFPDALGLIGAAALQAAFAASPASPLVSIKVRPGGGRAAYAGR